MCIFKNNDYSFSVIELDLSQYKWIILIILKTCLTSIQDYEKIIILFFNIKQDNDLLTECGLSQNEIKSLYNEGRKDIKWRNRRLF